MTIDSWNKQVKSVQTENGLLPVQLSCSSQNVMGFIGTQTKSVPNWRKDAIAFAIEIFTIRIRPMWSGKKNTGPIKQYERLACNQFVSYNKTEHSAINLLEEQIIKWKSNVKQSAR